MYNQNLQTQSQYQQTALSYSLMQWGCGVGALALVSISAMIKHPAMHQIRAAAGIGAIGLTIVGNSSRKDYEDAIVAGDRVTKVLTDNTIAWIHASTQPTRQSLKQSTITGEAIPVMPLFDWSGLQDADEHPVLAIISPMGGGKSRLAKWLARHICFPGTNPDIGAIDIYGRKSDWNAIASTPPDILAMMTEDLLVLSSREKSYREGQDSFSPIFRVLEETPDVLASIQTDKASRDLVDRWFTKYTTTTRKVKARLCLISVKMSGVESGLGAESRDNSTVIFPGLKGCSKAMTDQRMLKLGTKANAALRESLLNALNGIRHPALVFHQGQWYPASIPELDGHGNPSGQSYHPELSDYLEPLCEYLKEKGEISSRDLKKSWGRNNGANAQTLDQLLDILQNYQKITYEQGHVKWISNTP